MIAGGDLASLGRPGTSLDLKRPITIAGIGLGEGVGLGHVFLHEPRVVVTALIGEDVEHETGRLDEAIAGLRLFVDDYRRTLKLPGVTRTAGLGSDLVSLQP